MMDFYEVASSLIYPDMRFAHSRRQKCGDLHNNNDKIKEYLSIHAFLLHSFVNIVTYVQNILLEDGGEHVIQIASIIISL
jgi:hypothetical protein